MNKSQKIIMPLISSVLAIALTTACSPGAQTTAGSAGAAVSGNGNNSQGGPGSNPVSSWQAVTTQMNSSVSGGPLNSYPLIEINPTAQTIELLIPLSFSLGGLTPILPGSISISSVKGVTIGPVTLPDGSSGWAVSVPLKYLLAQHSAGLAPLGTLPNGMPLPNFPSEQIDGIQITLPQQSKYQIYLYVGLKAVAVYVAVPGITLPIGFSYAIINAAQTSQIGDFSVIPQSGQFPGGLYVAAQIPTAVSLELNSLVSF